MSARLVLGIAVRAVVLLTIYLIFLLVVAPRWDPIATGLVEMGVTAVVCVAISLRDASRWRPGPLVVLWTGTYVGLVVLTSIADLAQGNGTASARETLLLTAVLGLQTVLVPAAVTGGVRSALLEGRRQGPPGRGSRPLVPRPH